MPFYAAFDSRTCNERPGIMCRGHAAHLHTVLFFFFYLKSFVKFPVLLVVFLLCRGLSLIFQILDLFLKPCLARATT